MVRILSLLCASLLIVAVFGDDPVADIEISQESILDLELKSMDPAGCPGVDGCLHACLLGRKRDEQGCRTCECNKNGLLESDILVSDKDFWRAMERYDATAPMTPPPREKRGAMSLKESEWPRKGNTIEIPYILASSITGLKKKRIQQAIEEYRSRTCLRFVPRVAQTDYIEFTGLGYCSSHVGKIGGKQQITIGTNCENKLGTVIHEMMHAIGFWHEQSRGDRDYYVEIKWDNVVPQAKGNFKKQERFWNNYGSIYDLESVMHYGGEFFTKSRGQPTIVNRKTGETIEAQRENFSPEDVRQINLKYKCASYLKNDKPVKMPVFATEVVCKDDLSLTSCQKYQKKGYCKYANFKDKCQVTCGVCEATAVSKPAPAPTVAKKAEACKDSSKNCAVLKGKGFCTTSKKTMDKFCKKTCNLCRAGSAGPCKDTSSKCKKWVNAGYCNKSTHKAYLAKACKASCGHCSRDADVPEALFDLLVTN